MFKLPVIQTTLQAYAFVWQRRRQFWALAIPAIAIVAITSALTSWLQWLSLGRPATFAEYQRGAGGFIHSDATSAFFVLAAAGVVVSAVVLVLYSVAWHRIYLIPGTAQTPASVYRWQGRQTRFLLNYLKIFLLMIPAVVAAGVIVAGLAVGLSSAGGSGPLAAIAPFLPLAAVSVVFWVWARFSMLFPACAVDHPMKIGECWRFSKGNGWRILWVIILTALPIGVISAPLNFAIAKISLETGLMASLTAGLGFALITQFFAFIAIAIGVSALSIAFQQLSANQPAQTPPSE